MEGENETPTLQDVVREQTLINAAKHDGKAQVGSVMSTIMGHYKELRQKAREIKPLVEEEVNRVNQLSLDAIHDALKKRRVDLDALSGKKIEEKGLPDLPGCDKIKKPKFRMAPYPSGPLHIGNARMVVLNDEYTKLTKGTLVLCFDDTIGTTKKKLEEDDSGAKFVVPEGYDLIREGLRWLGVEWHEEAFKSDRMEIYSDYCKKLIEMDKAYVCTCDPGEFKSLKDKKRPCPHRETGAEVNLAEWDRMVAGDYDEGEAVVRLKSGVDLKDPALREPVIMRISRAEHPRVGTKYHLWPMLEFSWAIDDHLLGITHIIRGKDLFKEDFIEEFIWDLMGWEKKYILHYGMISFHDNQASLSKKLSKTHAREEISKGNYTGWDDPRTWSMQSLARRGIQPEALRSVLLGMGLSMVDVDFPITTLYAENQKLIDPIADRYFFVANPVKLRVTGIPEKNYVAKPLLNPIASKSKKRSINIEVRDGCKDILISQDDYEEMKADEGSITRLKDLFNIKCGKVSKEKSSKILSVAYHSKELDVAREEKARIIHWVDGDKENSASVKVLMPDGNIIEGSGEMNLISVAIGTIVQFERFGFVKIQYNTNKEITAWLTH